MPIEPTWKMLIRATWLPNVVILILLALLACTDQGWLSSRETKSQQGIEQNRRHLEQIEQRIDEIDKATVQWRAERADQHKRKP